MSEKHLNIIDRIAALERENAQLYEIMKNVTLHIVVTRCALENRLDDIDERLDLYQVDRMYEHLVSCQIKHIELAEVVHNMTKVRSTRRQRVLRRNKSDKVS